MGTLFAVEGSGVDVASALGGVANSMVAQVGPIVTYSPRKWG